MTTTTAPPDAPRRMPKVSDHGDRRYYHHRCADCGTTWEGAWHSPAAYDTDCSEPYTLRENGDPCGSFSYERAADMHADFAAAVADHDCAPPPPTCRECDAELPADNTTGECPAACSYERWADGLPIEQTKPDPIPAEHAEAGLTTEMLMVIVAATAAELGIAPNEERLIADYGHDAAAKAMAVHYCLDHGRTLDGEPIITAGVVFDDPGYITISPFVYVVQGTATGDVLAVYDIRQCYSGLDIAEEHVRRVLAREVALLGGLWRAPTAWEVERWAAAEAGEASA